MASLLSQQQDFTLSDAVPKLTVPAFPSNYVVTLLGNTVWTIGRGKENSIVIKDTLVSRRHAMLQAVQFNGMYLIYFSDLNSLNGSLLNQRKVDRQMQLAHGDQITVGNAILKFHYPEGVAVAVGQ
jgi:adenylate cyclase